MYTIGDLRKEFGLSRSTLEDIAKLLDMNKTNISDILSDRLKCIQSEITSLKKQIDAFRKKLKLH